MIACAAPARFLELEAVDKSFDGKVVLKNLTLAVARGESLAVLGASGSGKSVLLKLLMGLVKPDAGAIRLEGRDLVPLTEEALFAVRTRMAMLFQGGALFDSLTIAENVAYPLRVRGTFSAPEIAARVHDRLAVVGLEGVEQLMPAQLSGGMRKRAALARAIVGDPELILYDEPTAGLDPISARRITDLIRATQTRPGVTSIIVTHDLACAALAADRMAMLSGNRIDVVLPAPDFLRCDAPAVRAFASAMQADLGRDRKGVSHESRLR